MTEPRVKRVFDIVVTVLALAFVVPAMLLIAVAVKVEHPGLPLLFSDMVAGKNGRPFRFFKFRTMLPHQIDYRHRPEVLPGNALVTGVGRWLRRFKLDELPQFLHVLVGQMSVVGPRPMDTRRYQAASEFFKQRCLVKPGLTGLAQVGGNIHLTWEDRMEMDIWYIQRWSMRLDLEIIYRTIGVIVFGEQVLEELAASYRLRDHSVRVRRVGEAA